MTKKITIKNFTAHLAMFVTSQAETMRLAHGLAVCAIAHAQKHGDCIYINQLFEALNVGKKNQFRRYAVMVTAIDFKDVASSWLDIVNKQWVIRQSFVDGEYKDTTRAAFLRIKDKPEVLLNSAAELIDHDSFMVIDTDKIKNPFNDDSIVASLNRIVRNAQKDGAEVSTELVSRVSVWAKEAKKLAEATSEQDNEEEDTPIVPVHEKVTVLEAASA